MSPQNYDQDRPSHKLTQSSRRKFLIRTTAGVAITTLPAQSAWGACNASGISGGSQSLNTTCVLPDLTGGYGVRQWRKYLNVIPGEDCSGYYNDNDKDKDKDGCDTTAKDDAEAAAKKLVKTMFPNEWNELVTYHDIQDVIKSRVITLGGSLSVPNATFTIGVALENQGQDRFLAAYYLNAAYGFYGNLDPYSDAHELMEHVWGTLYVLNNKTVPTNFGKALRPSFTRNNW